MPPLNKENICECGKSKTTMARLCNDCPPREKIIKKLGDYHRKQGVAFLSEKDAIDYFRGLVELIEELLIKGK